MLPPVATTFSTAAAVVAVQLPLQQSCHPPPAHPLSHPLPFPEGGSIMDSSTPGFTQITTWKNFQIGDFTTHPPPLGFSSKITEAWGLGSIHQVRMLSVAFAAIIANYDGIKQWSLSTLCKSVMQTILQLSLLVHAKSPTCIKLGRNWNTLWDAAIKRDIQNGPHWQTLTLNPPLLSPLRAVNNPVTVTKAVVFAKNWACIMC